MTEKDKWNSFYNKKLKETEDIREKIKDDDIARNYFEIGLQLGASLEFSDNLRKIAEKNNKEK
jgi:hypothetical protein